MVTQALDAFDPKPTSRCRSSGSTGQPARTDDRDDPRLGRALRRERTPAAVIVQGDTTTALAGAMAAFWRRIPVVHLEAGLRSGDLDSPFPEEANRRLVAQVAALHLAPTPLAAMNLLDEGVDPADVLITGNTVVDAALAVAGRGCRSRTPRSPEVDAARAAGPPGPGTAHRRESWGEPLDRVLAAVADLVATYPDIQVVLPATPTRRSARRSRPASAACERVTVTDPLPYPALCPAAVARRTWCSPTRAASRRRRRRSGCRRWCCARSPSGSSRCTPGCAKLVGTDADLIVAEAPGLLDDPARAGGDDRRRQPLRRRARRRAHRAGRRRPARPRRSHPRSPCPPEPCPRRALFGGTRLSAMRELPRSAARSPIDRDSLASRLGAGVRRAAAATPAAIVASTAAAAPGARHREDAGPVRHHRPVRAGSARSTARDRQPELALRRLDGAAGRQLQRRRAGRLHRGRSTSARPTTSRCRRRSSTTSPPTTKPVIWIYDNIWQLTARDPTFAAKHGFTWTAVRLRPRSSTGRLQGHDADPRHRQRRPASWTTSIADPTKATTRRRPRSAPDGTTFPWAVRSGNFTYVGEIPFAYVTARRPLPRLRRPAVRRARPGDAPTGTGRWSASRTSARTPTRPSCAPIADYLSARRCRSRVAVYPRYRDPKGVDNNGRAEDYTLRQRPLVVGALKYMQSQGRHAAHARLHPPVRQRGEPVRRGQRQRLRVLPGARRRHEQRDLRRPGRRGLDGVGAPAGSTSAPTAFAAPA